MYDTGWWNLSNQKNYKTESDKKAIRSCPFMNTKTRIKTVVLLLLSRDAEIFSTLKASDKEE